MRYEYVASCKSDNDQFIIYRDSVTKKFYAVESNYEIEDPDLDYIIDYSFKIGRASCRERVSKSV